MLLFFKIFKKYLPYEALHLIPVAITLTFSPGGARRVLIIAPIWLTPHQSELGRTVFSNASTLSVFATSSLSRCQGGEDAYVVADTLYTPKH